MNITLYKNCCLNNKYQEVFYNTKLETYLNSLNKFSLTLENTYYENNMELVIDYAWFETQQGSVLLHEIYDFNYCKITELGEGIPTYYLSRYCFIKSIVIKNGCVYLELEEDIWASYSAKMQGTNVCVLSNSRKTTYGSGMVLTPLELPYNYDGNNKLKLESISYANLDYPYVYMLVEFQLYDLTTYDKPNSDREVFYAIVRYRSQDYNASLTFLETNARTLMKSMASNKIRGKQYQVGNIYAIPVGMLDLTNDFKTEESLFESLFMSECLNPKEHIVLSGTINNNYKNLFIGVLDNYISLINNGTNIEYNIKFSCCDAGISLKLNCSNQIIDITNSFIYEVPFQGILSEEYATRKISNNLKLFKLETESERKQITGVLSIGNAMFSGLGSVFSETSGGVFGGVKSMVNDIKTSIFNMRGVGDGYQQDIDAEKWTIQTPKYSNSKGVISNLNSISNICYGLVLGKINPDNNEFVKKFVDNYGYSSFFFIDSAEKFNAIFKTDHYNQETFHYNTIRVSSPCVYGSFTNEIAEQLNNILRNGVKIWYDATRTEDTYTNSLLS